MLPAGKIVVVTGREMNSKGRQYSLVHPESDENAPTEWLQSAHVLPLPSGGRAADTTQRRLAASLQGSPQSPATSPTGGRHVREAQNSSGALRPSTVAATPARHAQNPLDVDHLAQLLQVLPRTAPAPACTRRRCVLVLGCCLLVHPMRSVCCCAQDAREEGQSPTYPESCAYDTVTCLPTTRHCKHPGCSRLVCDPCAQKMCPDGENENDYHWCARHKPGSDEEHDEGDSESSDPFAWRRGGHRFV